MYSDSEEIEQIEDRISQLEKSIELLQSKLSSTHPLNDVFKDRYIDWFPNRSRRFVPNIDEFINDPPSQSFFGDYKGAEHADYEFWCWFEKKYLEN